MFKKIIQKKYQGFIFSGFLDILNVKSACTILFSFLLSIMLAGCGGSSSGNDDTPSPSATSIEFSDIGPSPTLIEGQSLTLKATLINDDGSVTNTVNADFEWATENETIATVSSEGTIAAVSPGTTALTVRYGEITTDISIEVEQRILSRLDLVLTPSTIPLGTSSTLKVFGIYNDETREMLDDSNPISLQTSNTSTVQIDPVNFGRIVSSGIGTATVTASSDSGISSSVTIEITPALVTDLMISSEALTIPAGFPAALSATASYTDGSQREVTSDVVWSVSGADGASC
ncbi:Ig-like domain-containing protein [uncultured Marinobacter sp.]|uniref:Ig-like domain-containing protein n=1 Tax=uncultured Marinobacter sp. TaxID=187379 RepID=UPI0030DC9222